MPFSIRLRRETQDVDKEPNVTRGYAGWKGWWVGLGAGRLCACRKRAPRRGAQFLHADSREGWMQGGALRLWHVLQGGGITIIIVCDNDRWL